MVALSTAQASAIAGTRVLVVEDHDIIRNTIATHLEERGAQVRATASVAEALLALAENPAVIVLDVQLPDGTGVEIAEAAAKRRPVPRIVVTSGAASARQSFALGRLRATMFLGKPFELEELDAALSVAPDPVQDLSLASALAVGQLGLVEARDIVRASMTGQALAVAEGNRTRAAETLGVTRQAVQHLAR